MQHFLVNMSLGITLLPKLKRLKSECCVMYLRAEKDEAAICWVALSLWAGRSTLVARGPSGRTAVGFEPTTPLVEHDPSCLMLCCSAI